MFWRFCAFLCASFALITASVAEAARVSPMVVEMEPTGRSAVARINLYNEADRTVPFEVRMVKAEISVDGELSVEPADDDFLVFPTQVILEARRQQVFRIQYVGEPELAQSQIYYMSIRQVPVDFEEAGVAQVQVVVNYNVLVNVVPNGAEAMPVVRSIEAVTRLGEATPPQAQIGVDVAADAGEPAGQVAAETEPAPDSSAPADEELSVDAVVVAEDVRTVSEDAEENGANSAENTASEQTEVSGIEVLVGNEGNRYFLAGFSTWKISGSNTDGTRFETTFKPGDIARQIGAGVVGPGRDRLFFLPLEDRVDRSTISIEIDP